MLEVISRSAFDLSAVFGNGGRELRQTVWGRQGQHFSFRRRGAVAWRPPTTLLGQFDGLARAKSDSVRAGTALRPVPRSSTEPSTVADVASRSGITHTGARDVEPISHACLACRCSKAMTCSGVIVVYRMEVRPFTDKQIALVETFADQAVIAIENVRLFEAEHGARRSSASRWSSRPRPQRCCRSSRSSPGELEPVFNAMLENAIRICEAKFGNLFLRRGRRLSRGGGAWQRPTMPTGSRREPLISRARSTAAARSTA